MLKQLRFFLCLVVGVACGFVWGFQFDKNHVFPYNQAKTIQRHFSNRQSDISPDIESRAGIYSAFPRKADIVMIGDSLTDNAEWGDLFPTASIARRGIAGDTSKGIISRFGGILSVGAKKAFVLVGINDLARGQSVESVLANYSTIAKTLSDNGARVYIQSTLFCKASLAPSLFHCRDNLPKITALNFGLQKLAQESGYTFIDLNSKLSDGGELNAAYTWDGVHLNALGYKLWKGAIEQYIN